MEKPWLRWKFSEGKPFEKPWLEWALPKPTNYSNEDPALSNYYLIVC